MKELDRIKIFRYPDPLVGFWRCTSRTEYFRDFVKATQASGPISRSGVAALFFPAVTLILQPITGCLVWWTKTVFVGLDQSEGSEQHIEAEIYECVVSRLSVTYS